MSLSSSPPPKLPDSASRARPKATPKHQRRIQGTVAIAAGALPILFGMLGLVGLLTGISPDLAWFLAIFLTSLVLATTGGYLVALLAPAQPLNHSLILMGIVSVLWLTAVLWPPITMPWSLGLSTLAPTLLGISTGAWLRGRQLASVGNSQSA